MKFRGVSFELEKATQRLICVELTAGSNLMFLITVFLVSYNEKVTRDKVIHL